MKHAHDDLATKENMSQSQSLLSITIFYCVYDQKDKLILVFCNFKIKLQ